MKQVPEILQVNPMECGAACLAMVLGAHGYHLPLSELANELKIGRDGVSAKTLLQAARRYGLEAKAYQISLEGLQHLPTPAILHWEFNHYVVLCEVREHQVVIIDPRWGRKIVEYEELSDCFTGIGLGFKPTEAFQPHRPAGRPLIQVWRHLTAGLQLRWLALGVILASLLLQGLTYLTAQFTGVLVDRLTLKSHLELLPLLGLAILAGALCYAAVIGWRGVLLNAVQLRADLGMTQRFVYHLLGLPYTFFSQRPSGDLLMRLSSVGMLRELLTNQAVSTLLDATLMFGYAALLIWKAPVLGGVALGLAALHLLIIFFTSKRQQQLAKQELHAKSAYQSHLVELLHGMATIKASGAEEEVGRRWQALNQHALQAALKTNLNTSAVNALVNMVRLISPALLLFIGAQQVLAGSLSLGEMLALATLAGSMLAPVSGIATTAQQVLNLRVHLDRLLDVLSAEREQDPEKGIKRELRGSIAFQNVSFQYSQDALPTVRGLSFELPAGAFVALVGQSGSGKSTIQRLLLGLEQPSEGQISIDGYPLETLNRRHLRQQIGTVLQEPYLFSGTIFQNVAFGREISLEQVMYACRLAALHEEITRLPLGYFTLLTEGGQGLSGGQRQRLALARALVELPKVLLLDEATSHLDNLTEARVHRNLEALKCTRLVVAHRLSTVRHADLIIVLHAGEIVESGTHEQLLAAGGHYAALFAAQQAPDSAPPRKLGPAFTIDLDWRYVRRPSIEVYAVGGQCAGNIVPVERDQIKGEG